MCSEASSCSGKFARLCPWWFSKAVPQSGWSNSATLSLEVSLLDLCDLGIQASIPPLHGGSVKLTAHQDCCASFVSIDEVSVRDRVKLEVNGPAYVDLRPIE